MVRTNYTLTVYKNTGFNGIDIPAEPSVLENADKQVYNDTYFLREDLDNPQIMVNDAYRNLSDVDYVKLQANSSINNQPNTFYYFAVPHAGAGGMTVLSLDLDALLTCGGAKHLDYISGWQERGHIAKSEDELFGNVAPEEFMPSRMLETVGFEDIDTGSQYGTDEKIIISNIDIVKMGEVAGEEIEAIEGKILSGGSLADTVMYLPKIPVCENSTIFIIRPTSTQANSFGIPNTMAFDANNANVVKGLNYLFSCGQLQLTNSYTLDKNYIGSTPQPDNHGRITQIDGIGNNFDAQHFPFEYVDDGYTPKNKKCFTMFRSFTLANIASSASMTKEPHELKNGNSLNPIIRIWADLSSTGKPYARFLSDVLPENSYINAVIGAPWVTHQILLEGASGSMWNSIQNAFNQQTIDRDIATLQTNRNYVNQMYQNDEAMLNLQKYNKIMGLGSNVLNVIGNASGIPSGAGAKSNAGALTGLGEGAGLLGSGMSLGAGMVSSHYEMKDAYARLSMANQKANYDFAQNENALNQAINENRIGLLKSNSVVAPTVMFTPEPNLAMYGYNKFVLYETRMTKQDLMALDDYFQRYGYNGLHRKLTANCFDCRDYYSYVQAFDVNFKVTGKSIGLRIRNKAISQLNSGVRVWKVLPDASYYENN